ncbi:MAG: hypothetical protein WCO45_06630 [Pseudanabaena sp. ELA607]|jgi:hypothetical protein
MTQKSNKVSYGDVPKGRMSFLVQGLLALVNQTQQEISRPDVTVKLIPENPPTLSIENVKLDDLTKVAIWYGRDFQDKEKAKAWHQFWLTHKQKGRILGETAECREKYKPNPKWSDAITNGDIRDGIKHYLKESWLGILEETRQRPRAGNGSNIWNFKLKIWSTDLDKNEKDFDAAWEEKRNGRDSRTLKIIQPSYSESTNIKVDSLFDLPYPFNLPEWKDKLRKEFIREAKYSLCDPKYFSKKSYEESIGKFYKDPCFQELINKNKSIVSEIDKNQMKSFSSRIAEIDILTIKLLLEDSPIRLVVGPGGIGTILIIQYLKNKGLNFELIHDFPGSNQIVETIIRGDFPQTADAITLDPSSAMRLLLSTSKSEYLPLMLLPSCSNCFSTGSNSTNPDDDIRKGEYLFLGDLPTTALLYFDDMKNLGRIEHHTNECIDPDDLIFYLSEKDHNYRTVLWWPYYMFHELFGLSKPVKSVQKKWQYDVSFLFVHDSIHRNTLKVQSLVNAIKSAWFELALYDYQIEKGVDALMSDSVYIKLLYKFNGLQAINRSKIELLKF